NAGFDYRTVVVQVRHLRSQRLGLSVGRRGQSLGLIGAAAGVHGLGISLGGFLIHSLDALLGAGVHVANVARILRRQVVQSVGFVDNWLCLLANIILGRATGAKQQARASQ